MVASTPAARTTTATRTAPAWGLFGGYQFNRYVAVEAGVRRLLEHHYTYNSWDANGNWYRRETRMRQEQRALSVLGTLPVAEKVSLLGRVGHNEVISRYEPGDFNSRKKGLLLGAGLSYKLAPNVDARLELQRANSDTRNVSAGIAYKF
jgi:OOP family OmpA-OmpF porin